MCRHIWWLFKLWILASHGLFEMFTSCFVFLKTYFNKITCLNKKHARFSGTLLRLITYECKSPPTHISITKHTWFFGRVQVFYLLIEPFSIGPKFSSCLPKAEQEQDKLNANLTEGTLNATSSSRKYRSRSRTLQSRTSFSCERLST